MIKFGFVDALFKKGALWAKPPDGNTVDLSGEEKNQNVVYLHWFWWPIMMIIRHIPEQIFKQIKL